MVIDSIRQKIANALRPTWLEVHNDSHLHRVPDGAETHFRVFVVSEAFSGKSRVERQRAVNEALSDHFKSGLHALSIKALSPEEFQKSSDERAQEAMACAHNQKRRSDG